MSDERRCRNCVAFEPDWNDPEVIDGECRAQPPQGAPGMIRFPLVGPGDWCLRFEPREAIVEDDGKLDEKRAWSDLENRWVKVPDP